MALDEMNSKLEELSEDQISEVSGGVTKGNTQTRGSRGVARVNDQSRGAKPLGRVVEIRANDQSRGVKPQLRSQGIRVYKGVAEKFRNKEEER